MPVIARCASDIDAGLRGGFVEKRNQLRVWTAVGADCWLLAHYASRFFAGRRRYQFQPDDLHQPNGLARAMSDRKVTIAALSTHPPPRRDADILCGVDQLWRAGVQAVR